MINLQIVQKKVIKPIIAARYSPNNTKNISDKDLRINYDNIFSFNRIGTTDMVEGGRSISLGLEYEKRNIDDRKIFGFNIANSLTDRKRHGLPKKSKLNETRSDVVGKISFSPNEVLNLDYNFSYDRDLSESNYDSISASINVNNFMTNFDFLSQGGDFDDAELITNTTTFKFNNENNIKFKATKDLVKDFTEYYNLIYSYETDCLLASVEYNKKFYQDGSLMPDKSLLFYIKFIPFAEIKPAATKIK